MYINNTAQIHNTYIFYLRQKFTHKSICGYECYKCTYTSYAITHAYVCTYTKKKTTIKINFYVMRSNFFF